MTTLRVCNHGDNGEPLPGVCHNPRGNRSKAALDGWRKSSRACADCSQYAAVSDMIKKSGGRIICPGCQKAIDARERDQENMFVSQPALF